MSARVLIVDDHAPFRALARRLLTADGFDIVGEAADGASAIDAARALHPDVVLLDVQLPDVDGFRVAQALAGRAVEPADRARLQPVGQRLRQQAPERALPGGSSRRPT